ncbi:hypothetical protein [Halobaculum litoreum]|uniref:Trypsin n=1 Tax=Halobaculum litoreum TaxID=3031998 RepID=A0ABD5XWP9_9EURY|nr:hypothetical protein [Halobaculum sp. DT92]
MLTTPSVFSTRFISVAEGFNRAKNSNVSAGFGFAADDGGYAGVTITGTFARDELVDKTERGDSFTVRGRTTGISSGTLTDLRENSEGRIRIIGDAPTEGGDSGGPWYAEDSYGYTYAVAIHNGYFPNSGSKYSTAMVHAEDYLTFTL